MASRKMPRRLQQSLLRSILHLLADAGLDDASIRAAFATAMTSTARKRAAASEKVQCGPYLHESDLSADLLRRWHRDARYIDDVHAKPKALQLTKGRLSIRAMALDLHPGANVPELLRFLTGSGLIYKCPDGKFLPTNEVGAISHSGKFVAEHVAKSVIRFISTVRRNTKTGHLGQSMIERFAYVSDLNPADIQGFCEFTKSQGHSYLQAVDDWMEHRRVRSRDQSGKSHDGVFAGLHIIAYLGDGSGLEHGADAASRRGSEGSDEETRHPNGGAP